MEGADYFFSVSEEGALKEGLHAHWDHDYKTMDHSIAVRAFAKIVGFVFDAKSAPSWDPEGPLPQVSMRKQVGTDTFQYKAFDTSSVELVEALNAAIKEDSCNSYELVGQRGAIILLEKLFRSGAIWATQEAIEGYVPYAARYLHCDHQIIIRKDTSEGHLHCTRAI
jgi:hypothetical protein